MIEAGERNQPLPLGSQDRKPPLSLGRQLRSGFQEPQGGTSRGPCALSQHLPHSHPRRSSAEDPRPWGGGGDRMRGTSLGPVSSLQHLLYCRGASHPPPPDHSSGRKAQKSSGEFGGAKRGGDGDSPAARLSWKGRLIPVSAPAAAQGWGPGCSRPKFCPAPRLPAPGREVPPLPAAQKVRGLLSSF